jgi:hypothetical protein
MCFALFTDGSTPHHRYSRRRLRVLPAPANELLIGKNAEFIEPGGFTGRKKDIIVCEGFLKKILKEAGIWLFTGCGVCILFF